MAENDPDEDLVQIKTRSSVDRRTAIDVGTENADTASAALVNKQTGGDGEIRLRSAALMIGEQRVPIPSGGGLTLGSGENVDVVIDAPGVGALQAAIEATSAGHVIVERGKRSETYLNGEILGSGERRPLRRGDSIALGGELLHYLPPGETLPTLAPVRPVDAGHVRTTGRELTIGRDPTCDIVLDHPTVSLHHATIRPRRGGTTINDLGSSAGTRVNEIAIRSAPLVAGDQIAIGPFRIVFDGEELFQRAAPSGLAIVASQVCVEVESGTILQPTDVHLRAGELVAIIGESGAGKSTLLKALAGVSLPTRGQVMIGGEPVQVRLSELGYVPQFDIVHDELTVTEALDFAARLRLPADTDEAARAARVGEVVSELGLGDRAELRVSRLSGGQRKRVAVGIELLHRPGALFLDEPTTGLDPHLERHMTTLFRQLADSGQTVALVTHATGSMSLYDRVIVMGKGGFLRYDGPPEELLEQFGVEQYDDVYTALTGADAGAAAHVPSNQLSLPPLPPLHGVQDRPRRPVQQTFWHQARVLTTRYALLTVRDTKHLRSALVQVPILALLTAVLFTSKVFVRFPVTEFAAKGAQLTFLMVTIAVWLGSINAAREIVKERHVLARELAIGVRIAPYLASKLAVLFAMAAAQIVLFAVIVLVLRPLHESSFVEYQLVAVLVIAGFVAALLGLLVSAYAASEDQATGVIPLLLVPQLLFSGALVQSQDMTALVKVFSVLVPARWSFAAAGHTIQMQNRIDADPVFSRISRYGHSFFSVNFAEFILISGVFAAVLFAGITRLLRSRPVA
ncbi:MAG: ATP-binding cassette domain-containing protein [Solirubrobacteraceae bacterium]